MNSSVNTLPSSLEKGSLGIYHLKRYWAIAISKRNGQCPADAFVNEWTTDLALLNMLGLGLEQTIIYLYRESPSFEVFEKWVLDINSGQLDRARLDNFNRLMDSGTLQENKNIIAETVIGPAEKKSWEENGYLVLTSVISREECAETVDLIASHIGINIDDPATWYNKHPARQGIMVQLFQHPQLEKNRQTPVVRKAYEELWGRTDLIVSVDRVGFNPPETEQWSFPGPYMHWDVSLELPVPFGLQGILYLTDTAADQGAFSLVPGFHNRIEDWIKNLPPGHQPREENIYALGVKPIAAKAGDFIIWHHALPHGSSPNHAAKPRFVQYINWTPPDPELIMKWK